MERDLDNLTPEQREKVGNFMAITAINNTTHAIQFLEMCNYNLQVDTLVSKTSKASSEHSFRNRRQHSSKPS